MTAELKDYIDSLNYEDMLRLNRFAPAGHEAFIGEAGGYFLERMARLKEQLPNDARVRISKRVGWGKA